MPAGGKLKKVIGRSRKGAWIEILSSALQANVARVAPVRERGLKSLVTRNFGVLFSVAPVRERGLKCHCSIKLHRNRRSLP